MIQLVLPVSDRSQFVNVQYRCYAIPYYDMEGCSQFSDYRSPADFLNESRSVYHENNVIHGEADGIIRYDPLATSDVIPNPSETYPEAAKVKTKSGGFAAFYRGLVQHRYTARQISSTQYVHSTVECGGGHAFTHFELMVMKANPTVVRSASVYYYDVYKIDKNAVYFKIYRYILNVKPTSERAAFGNWCQKRTHDEIVTAILALADYDMGISYSTHLISEFYSNVSISVANARRTADAYVAGLVQLENPIEQVHFGELAMEASTRIRRVNINMLEFLADLKEPQRLIPKLKNLRNLKTLASNYLGVKYGVLPTVDDLTTIYEAFVRRKPHLDRFGLTTVHAGCESEQVSELIEYKLEQRIKLAVDTEDSGFSALCNAVDSVGMLPELSSIWDLIPLSFCVDWLVDIGDLLERVDMRQRVLRYDIRYATCSVKDTRRIRATCTGLTPVYIDLTWKSYHRWVDVICPVPPLQLQSNIQPQNHWLEAGALLVARRK